jgi:4'-phosphopantetheinyl transferase
VLDLIAFALRPARREDWQLLDDAEHARAQRLIIESKRDQFVLSRANLRRVIGRARGIDPRELRFEYGDHDKPENEGGVMPSFNLSHSHRLAILGVTTGPVRLGVDIEHGREGRDFEGIARSFFSPREREHLSALPEAERAAAFYRAWSRKEAYLKALGTGLTFASSRFTMEFRRGHAPAVLATEYPSDDPGNWRLADIEIDARYAAAACWSGPELRLRPWRLGPGEPEVLPDGHRG